MSSTALRCSKCGSENLAATPFCPNCGTAASAIQAPPVSPPPPPPPGATADIRPWYKKKRWIIGGGLVILMIIGAAAGDSSSSGGGSSSSSSDQKYAAFEMCKDFVKDRLKAPSTATFRNFFQDDGEVSVSGYGDGPYTVMSTVDSQNGFGAKIRSSFSCTVTNTSGDNWRLNSISIE